MESKTTSLSIALSELRLSPRLMFLQVGNLLRCDSKKIIVQADIYGVGKSVNAMEMSVMKGLFSVLVDVFAFAVGKSSVL